MGVTKHDAGAVGAMESSKVSSPCSNAWQAFRPFERLVHAVGDQNDCGLQFGDQGRASFEAFLGGLEAAAAFAAHGVAGPADVAETGCRDRESAAVSVVSIRASSRSRSNRASPSKTTRSPF